MVSPSLRQVRHLLSIFLQFALLQQALLLHPQHLVLAQDASANADFDCHLSISGSSNTYDLTTLAGEHTLQRSWDTPPSTTVQSVRFDLCGELKPLDDVAKGDQCATGTRACLTQTNKKDSESDRVVAVIPLAQSESLNPDVAEVSSPRGVSVILHGPSYPSSPTSSNEVPQSINITVLCATDTSDWEFINYDGSQAQVKVSAPAGCSLQGQPDGDKDDEKTGDGEGGSGSDSGASRAGSGVGWFFLVLLLAILAYFGLGAYYNYTTYGASGADLIPHRDFWKEVPYMFSDLISHLCSSVRPHRTSNRSGYIAV